MKALGYSKRYGGSIELWKQTIEKQNTPKIVTAQENGNICCPTCGHICKLIKACNFCGQMLKAI